MIIIVEMLESIILKVESAADSRAVILKMWRAKKSSKDEHTILSRPKEQKRDGQQATSKI